MILSVVRTLCLFGLGYLGGFIGVSVAEFPLSLVLSLVLCVAFVMAFSAIWPVQPRALAGVSAPLVTDDRLQQINTALPQGYTLAAVDEMSVSTLDGVMLRQQYVVTVIAPATRKVTKAHGDTIDLAVAAATAEILRADGSLLQ